MFDRILVPLDGSPESEVIRTWVVGPAVELESVVDLLAVINPVHIGPSGTEVGSDAYEREAEFARNYLREQSDWFQERGVTTSTHVLPGDPPEVIIDQAKELDTRLIAMVTHRKSAVMRGIMGSVSDRVLHATGVPIMLARPGEMAGFENGEGLPRTIIVPLDGSNFAEGAIPYAEAMANRSDGEVLFLTGIAPNSSYAAYTLADPALSMYDDEAKPSTTEEYLAAVTERSARRGIKASSIRIAKPAAEAIIGEAGKSTDRLIVMTSHGASGIKRWLLGSVADKVIRSSEHPVIVIPPEHQQVSYRGQTRRNP